MTSEHPITPPPELVKQWWKEAQQADYSDGLPCWLNYVATRAARWGAQRMALYLSDQWADRVQTDLENGVRYLNSKAVAEFQRRYPNVSGFQSVISPHLPEDY